MTLVAYESFLMLSFGIQSVLDGRPESSHCCLMSSKTSSVVCFLTQSFISLFKLRHFHTTLRTQWSRRRQIAFCSITAGWKD